MTTEAKNGIKQIQVAPKKTLRGGGAMSCRAESHNAPPDKSNPTQPSQTAPSPNRQRHAEPSQPDSHPKPKQVKSDPTRSSQVAPCRTYAGQTGPGQNLPHRLNPSQTKQNHVIPGRSIRVDPYRSEISQIASRQITPRRVWPNQTASAQDSHVIPNMAGSCRTTSS